MNIDPKNNKVLLTEPPMNPMRNREKMIEVMFEKYGFDSVYIAIQAVLTSICIIILFLLFLGLNGRKWGISTKILSRGQVSDGKRYCSELGWYGGKSFIKNAYTKQLYVCIHFLLIIKESLNLF